jgi:hypothetical protein
LAGPPGLLSLREFLAQIPPALDFQLQSQSQTTNSNFFVVPAFQKWDSFQNDIHAIYQRLLDQCSVENGFHIFQFSTTKIIQESTLQAMFHQNVLDPLKRVFNSLDYSAPIGSEFNPDLVIFMVHQAHRNLPIEVKTLNTCPEDVYASYSEAAKNQWPVRQIYTYMCSRQIKYGVLTRYDLTYFFHVIIEGNSIILEVSDPIPLKDLIQTLFCFLNLHDLWDIWDVQIEQKPIILKDDGGQDDDGGKRGGRGGGNKHRGGRGGQRGGGGGQGDGKGGGSCLKRKRNVGQNQDQIGEHVLKMSYEVIGSGGCGTVLKASFDDQPVAIKLVKIRSRPNAIDEVLQEVAVYNHLKDLQGKCIPFLYWHGYLFHRAYYALVMSLCADADHCTEEEMEDVLRILRVKGAIQNDARPENFVRSSSPQRRLMAIDFGQTAIE